MISGRSYRRQLMSPGIPAFGKAVTEDDQRPLPRLCEVHTDTVGLDEALLCPSHKSAFRKSSDCTTVGTARSCPGAIALYLTKTVV